MKNDNTPDSWSGWTLKKIELYESRRDSTSKATFKTINETLNTIISDNKGIFSKDFKILGMLRSLPRVYDVNVLDLLIPEAGAFYIMDRAYLDFERLYALTQTGGFFVTRAKTNMNARRLYSAPTDRSTGLICDQTIALDGFYSSQHYPQHLRRIRFKDPETNKTLVFLTNHFQLPAATICSLYKSRWQVELFFKWIKQHLRIKRFLGTSENAVKTQIWIAVSVYVLIAIVKKRLNLEVSLHTLLQILSVTIFEKIELTQLVTDSTFNQNQTMLDNQLNLFDC